MPEKRGRGAKLPTALRDVLQREAYLLDIKHYSATDIVKALARVYPEAGELSTNTVYKLVNDQRKVVRAMMDETTVQQHLDAYLHTNKAVEHDAWRRLAQTKANAQNVPGLQSNILAASKNTATALGLLQGKGDSALPVDAFSEVVKALDALWDKPIPVSKPKAAENVE